MRKFLILSGTVAASVSLALLGSGAALADDDAELVGQTYADAAKAVKQAGGTPVIGTRMGDKLEEDDCLVMSESAASFMRQDFESGSFGDDDGEIRLNLNCNGEVASANTAGPSAASPEGRAAIQAAAEKKAQQEAKRQAALEEQEALEGVDTPDN